MADFQPPFGSGRLLVSNPPVHNPPTLGLGGWPFGVVDVLFDEPMLSHTPLISALWNTWRNGTPRSNSMHVEYGPPSNMVEYNCPGPGNVPGQTVRVVYLGGDPNFKYADGSLVGTFDVTSIS